jgi:arabinoxylan arabinofuranohydrolase
VTITVGQDLQVSASASIRCTAGKAFVLVTASNADPSAVGFTITSTFGTKSFTGIATGKSASQSFTTRVASVDAGSVTVDVSTTIDGSPVTKQLTVSYPATVCS